MVPIDQPLGLGLAGSSAALERAMPELAGRVDFVELHGAPPPPDLAEEVLGDPFAPPPSAEAYYAHHARAAADVLGVPAVAHLGPLDVLDGAGAAHFERLLSVGRGVRWLSAEIALAPLGLAGDRALLPFTDATALEAADRLRAAATRLSVPLLAANPPVELPVGELHLCELLARVAERAGAALRLDLGHLVAYQVVRGSGPAHRLSALPLERVVALHLGGGEVTHHRGVACWEPGGALAPEVLELLAALAERCPRLRAVALAVAADDEPRAVVESLEVVERVLGARRPTRGRR